MSKTQLKVYVPDQIAKDFDDEIKKSGETKSFVVTQLIKKEIKRRGRK